MDRFEQIINIKKALRDQMKFESQDKVKTNKFADYPWDDCIADQLDRGYDEESANNICGWIKANYQTNFAETEDGLESACWPGYIAIGTKDLDGRIVPNCVPEEKQSKEKFVIPSPAEQEKKEDYISRCISTIIDEYGQEQSSGICYGIWDKEHS
jgi:hypothetical protein